MIGSLRGRLLDRSATEVLVEVGGVGYRVTVSPAGAVAVGDLGDEVFLHIHHHVREDTQTLYGFAGRDERVCFEALLGAHGVGPALALAILSVHAPDNLRRALAADDLDALCLVPGVGRKSAVRLLVELKASLALPDIESAALASVASGNGRRSDRGEVREALTGLGYAPDEIRQAMLDLPDDGDPAVLLRQALRRMTVTR
ncbi:MAG: Holliday junction branch migration protein RuvA [Acidimicrobiales bacterium]